MNSLWYISSSIVSDTEYASRLIITSLLVIALLTVIYAITSHKVNIKIAIFGTAVFIVTLTTVLLLSETITQITGISL